jgi:hypothetical protein
MNYRENENAAIKIMAALTQTDVTVDSANLEIFEEFAELAKRDEDLQRQYPNLSQLFALALTTRLTEKGIKVYDNGDEDDMESLYLKLRAILLRDLERKAVKPVKLDSPITPEDINRAILGNYSACWLLWEIQNLKKIVDPDDVLLVENEIKHTLADTIDNLYSVFFDLLDMNLTEEDAYEAYDYIDTGIELVLKDLKFEIKVK